NELADLVRGGLLDASTDFSAIADCDIILICVPTPLSRQREPDLRFVEATAQTIAKHLRPGQLIVLESTTWPGTTEEVVKPILESTGMRSGSDFFLGFSPEREDPGNPAYATATIPKVVAGDGADALALVQAFYGSVVKQVVPVSCTATAEAGKKTGKNFPSLQIPPPQEPKKNSTALEKKLLRGLPTT